MTAARRGRRRPAVLTALLALLVVALTVGAYRHAFSGSSSERIRQELFDELQPVALAGCRLERFGERHDGGYLLCGNLLDGARSAYSYGISGYDGWGCEVSSRLGVPVHQYDCFDTRQPVCDGGRTIFHPVCVSGTPRTVDGRPFTTLAQHVLENGDRDGSLVVKMDVEGAEWESLERAPEDLLGRIDQLAIEFHGTDRERYLRVVRRLKRSFHVAHLHFNNYSCVEGLEPFPAWAYEVLFVNRRIAEVEPGMAPALPNPLDAPNRRDAADCQARHGG